MQVNMQRRFSRTSTDPDAAVDLESLPASAADDGDDKDDDGGGAAADEAVVRRHAAWLTALLFFLYCDQNLLAPHLSAVAAGAVAGGYSQPGWYHGRSHSDRHFSTTLAGSFNSVIASSSIAPGSSSGSSGGSSGGGGGGGGGGGW